MNDPDPRPTDERLAALFAATEKDAPPVDRAFLDQLRDRSLAAFGAAAPSTLPPTPRERTMSPFRWTAAAAAAVLAVGIVTAYWIATQQPAPAPPPGETFVVEGTLTDDGRIGKVTDAQGVVAVKPVAAERWSPVQPRLVLKPGDWLRTDARGANAAVLHLAKAVRLIVGPHSLVELAKADEVRLLAGELEITAPEAAPVELTGPGAQKVTIKGTQRFQVENDKLVRVEAEPLWLQGLKGATANESVGALVAKVDGRDVPLTVGYHHVTVDVRDQIARTTIEESFVNTTGGVLEGVFHFPLPADASISGFGMWIGDQLVEADVVEKQRAREIYEEILREKRDPGLLEWTGGNVFKARVYPIPARSEKRIKITYTQVLPLQGNRYRYSYALHSELLKRHPVRDLKIDVRVSSAVALKGVTSPTHPARVTATGHSGRVEFAAQEYTPTRDFEAVFEVEPGRPDVVVVPHRRGADGYFMVQLTPPGASADWERPLVPSGPPLRLLVVADTSASMDRAQRANQAAVLSALLGALTPKDTVNVAACDVNCDWMFAAPAPATPANVAAAQEFLAQRTSLGWTDLDAAFASALKMSAVGTHVVYLGDAVSTTGAADPVAFANRLQRLYAGKAGTFHAVALGSSYEPAALKAIGALGGGSVRRVSAERPPQATALDLLTEIAAPPLRDLKVEFTGLRTARVYPETLPNVPAGTQQILLGRYLPEGADQSGEIVVTGTLGGTPVRFASKVRLKDAEQGNSFVPRLWARMHLDKLLEQGGSEAVKRDVIALSEEFHIITPYTSLLVLETDADRERFAVKRRFQMRDGEAFFADGRDRATFELKQQQMKRAGDYRTALRRSVLAQLNRLGRDTNLFVRPADRFAEERLGDLDLPVISDTRGTRVYDTKADREEFFLAGANDAERGFADERAPTPAELNSLGYFSTRQQKQQQSERDNDAQVFDSPNQPFDVTLSDKREPNPSGFAQYAGEELSLQLSEDDYKFAGVTHLSFESYGLDAGQNNFGRYERWGRRPQLPWLDALFPGLAAPAREPKEPKTLWPAPALALSRSLLRGDEFGRLKGGLVITRQSDSFRGPLGELAARGSHLELVSPAAWLTRTASDSGPVAVSWCDANEFGTRNTAFQLGRVRASTSADLKRPPLQLADHSVTALHVSYAHLTPTVEVLAKGRALLVLKHKDSPNYETRVLIDTDRRVVLRTETRVKSKVTGRTQFGDFVEVAGRWWALRIETFDDKERRTALTTQTVLEVPADAFAKRLAQEHVGRDQVLFLKHPLPSVTDAKKAVVAGRATFDDRAVLVLHFAATQQWARALEHLQACETLAAGKPGARWLRDAFLLASRRHEELRTRLLDEAAALAGAAGPTANDYFLAEHLNGYASSVLQTNEWLALTDALRKVYERQPAHTGAVKAWRGRRITLAERAGQPDTALALAKALATDYPTDPALQHRYANALAGAGDYAAAYAWLDRALGAADKWDPYQADQLRELYADLLRRQGRYRDLAAYLAQWIARAPESERPYSRYLSALAWSNQSARAEALTAQWLREAQVGGDLAPAVVARLNAAVGFATGRAYDLSTNRVAERWHAPLADAARFFARSDEHIAIAAGILSSSPFASTDAARAARKELAAWLTQEIGTLSVARITALMGWVWSHDGTERGAWKAIAAALRTRWDAETDPDAKHRIAAPLNQVLSWLDQDEALRFLRAQLKDGPEAYRAGYASRLFDALLARPWTRETEDALFALLEQLPASDEPANALFTRVAALHRLTDALTEARFQARMRAVDRPDQLTRTELHKKQEENRKLAREGLADRLRAETARHPKPLADWITAERVWLEVPLDRNLSAAAADCWALLAAPAVKADPNEPGTAIAARLDEALRARAVVTLQNLAARKGADAALVDRVLKYLDRQPQGPAEAQASRGEKYRLLIALDRAKELEAELVRWTSEPDADNRWRLALGYLFAEQGKVADAITQFERVEAADELAPSAYRSLAEWYQVENRRAEHERAKAAVYTTTDEAQLNNLLNAYLSPWRSPSGRLPTQLDTEVLNIFRALFEKSSRPSAHLWQLRQFYQASHEPQLLSMLPDAVTGHTAERVYPFLQGMSGVLNEVRDEATADEIVKRIAAVRPAAKTPVDRRALDLLDLLTERRSAELLDQPGPHADKALAALERAFKHEWAAGEPRLMADFLAALGAVPQPALAKEQLRQLDVLHRGAGAGSIDRLSIARRYAEALGAHSRRPEAVDVLQSALHEFAGAHNGVLPTSANDALQALLAFHRTAEHYDRAEKVLLEQLTHPVHDAQKGWLTQRLGEVYHEALTHKGRVTLGEGEPLYKALEARLLADLSAPDQNQRAAALGQLTWLYRAAHELKLGPVAGDLKALAFDRLPKRLGEQVVNYESIVRDVSQTLHDLVGPRDAIGFLLDRAENEPEWMGYTNQDTWTQNNYYLAVWRDEVKGLGALEPRLLKVVLTELRRDLRSRVSRARTGYDRRQSYFWSEKRADFAAAADEVFAEQKTSGPAAEYIAEYLFFGLPHEKRAIEILFAAHAQKVLSESGRWQLADYLHRENRFAESVPVLVPLVAERPETITYRTKLMHAYFRTGKQAELLALLEQTHAFFHEKDRWGESPLAALAYSCLENRLFARAAAYYEELIPMRQRGAGRSGTGDGTLSSYYSQAARAYAGLGKTKEAVDMASGAVVVWGPRHEERRRALDALVDVLAGAPDLAGFAAGLDREPLQSAVVRKALGKAYIRLNDYARAVPQLQLAADLQPDPETYEALLACYDNLGDQTGAVQQLLRAIETSPRDIALFENLGRRYAELNRPAEAERAYTSVVEVLPHESEGHTRLAEVREKQGRWAEAIAQWERVAEIRALEPTGLLKLAAAQIESKAWDAATNTLRKLRSRTWPPRFTDVEWQTRKLEQKLEERSKK